MRITLPARQSTDQYHTAADDLTACGNRKRWTIGKGLSSPLGSGVVNWYAIEQSGPDIFPWSTAINARCRV